jgi:hypothetical protein
MTARELMLKLATLPADYPVQVLDNHTGDCLEITDVGTAADLDVDVAGDATDNVVIIMCEE